MPFLRLSSEATLQRITGELEAKTTENEQLQARLQRRSRELEVWELQLKTERENLMSMLQKEKTELNQLKEDLQRREADLATGQISIEAAEEANLKKTAEIYGKMEPERAAEVLTAMYAKNEQDTVVKIIYLMQDRNAANILAAITNPELSAEITRQLRDIRQNKKSGA
jgi:flagellar motility protein MotE (MotC chaperone)